MLTRKIIKKNACSGASNAKVKVGAHDFILYYCISKNKPIPLHYKLVNNGYLWQDQLKRLLC